VADDKLVIDGRESLAKPTDQNIQLTAIVIV
jgi:hypothetical protein